MESKAHSISLYYRASYRKTASHFSGRTLAFKGCSEGAGVLGWPTEEGHARVFECADTHNDGVKRALGDWLRQALKFQVDDGGRAFEVARAGDKGKGDVPLGKPVSVMLCSASPDVRPSTSALTSETCWPEGGRTV